MLIEYSKNSVTSLELPLSDSLCVWALSTDVEDEDFFAVDDDDDLSADDDTFFLSTFSAGILALDAADIFA